MTTATLTIDARSGSIRSAKGDLDNLTQSATRAERSVDRLGDEAAETGRQTEGLNRNVSGLGRAMGTAAVAAGGFAAALAAREYIQTADAISQLRGRIDLYTTSARETNAVIAALNETATRQGVAFTANAEIYARLAPAQDQLNLSSRQMLDITEAVGASFVVSGASAQEAEAAIIQLSQGLASGALRGEEYNAVAEQAPRLTMLLADALNLTTGELREFAAEGGLTADVVSGALLGGLSDLREEVESMPATVERSTARLGNAIGQLIDTTNQRFGITNALAEGIDALAENVDALANALSGDVSSRINATSRELELLLQREEELVAQGDSVNDALALRSDGYQNYRGELSRTRARILELQGAEQRLSEQLERDLQRQHAAETYGAIYGEAVEAVETLHQSVLTLVTGLEAEAEAVGRSRVATELYNAEREKGSALNEAEAQAIRERVAAIETAEAAERAAIEARREAERQAERQAAAEERAAERLAEGTAELRVRVEQESELLAALVEGEAAVEAVTRAHEIENAVREAGVDVTTEEGRAYRDLITQLYDLERARDSQRQAIREQERAQERLAREIEREIDAASSTATKLAIQGFEDGWDDALDTVGDMIERWVLENLIFEPIIRPIFDGSGMGGMGGLFGGAGGAGGFNPLGLLGGVGGNFGASLGGFLGNTAINFGAGAGTAQFLANSGLAIGNAAPYSLLGSILGSSLGLSGSGNGLVDVGLNLGGAVAGQALGGSIGALGAFGGPVGAVLGSLLGQGVGSLFGDEDYPYARGDVRIRNGQAVVTGSEALDGGDSAAVRQAAQGIADTINAALGQLGASGNFGGGTTFGTASGRSAALGSGFFAGADGGFSTGATFTGLESAEDAAARAVAFAISQAIGQGAIDLPAVLGRPFDAAMEIFERNAFDLDAAIADINFIQGFDDTLAALEGSVTSFNETIEGQARQQIESALAPLDQFIAKTKELGLDSERASDAVESYVRSLINPQGVDSLNQAQVTLDTINAQFDALAESVTRFGISVDEVEAGRENALANASGQFQSNVSNALLRATGQGYILEGQAFIDQIAELRAQAAIYGVGMSEVDQLADALLADILDGLDVNQIERLRDSLGASGVEFNDVFQSALDGLTQVVDTGTETITDYSGILREQARRVQDAIDAADDLSRSIFDYGSNSILAAQDERVRALDAEADALRRVSGQVNDFARGLAFGNNSPVAILDQFDIAQANYQRSLAAARSGDTAGAASLTSDAQTLLDLNSQINRSSVDGVSLFAQVQGELSAVGRGLESDAARAERRAERMASAAERQVEQLANLLKVSDDGFEGLRAEIMASAEVAALSGQTIEEYLASSQNQREALSELGFTGFEELVIAAFERANQTEDLDAFRLAVSEASESLSTTVEEVKEPLFAIQDTAASFNLTMGNVLEETQSMLEQVTAANDARDNAIERGIADLRDELSSLRQDNQELADRAARIAIEHIDVTERTGTNNPLGPWLDPRGGRMIA